jgi:hypothetical protein
MLLSDSVVPDRNVLCETRGQEALLFNQSNGRYYELDAVGTVIWQQLASGHSLEWIAGYVSGRYKLETETCTQELITFAAMLHKHGLVAKKQLMPPMGRRQTQ